MARRRLSVVWEQDRLVLLDQRGLSLETITVECTTPNQVASCIRDMVVRGAPAIRIIAAYGLVLAAKDGHRGVENAATLLRETHPTAVNLLWAIGQMLLAAAQHQSDDLYDYLLQRP